MHRILVCSVLLLCGFSAGALPPLVNAHAHNDYEHEHPLVDALSHGFWSVEADVWLTNGQLLVAHDFDKVSPDRTLEQLYLNPLREFVRTNEAAIRRYGPLTLLIDVKSDATNTWRALRGILDAYKDVLTRFEENKIATNAITIVISGNRATALLAKEPVRYAAIDGRLPDLDTNPPASLMPLVSDNWTKTFKWRGQGPLPDAERERLRALVSKAHQQGRRIRLWATPEGPAGWQALHEAGVDLINTDQLAELERFLRR